MEEAEAQRGKAAYLNGHVEGWSVECLEHDLGHLLSVGLWVERRLGEEDGVLLGRDSELVVERVVPDLLHVVPVGHDPVLDRVLEGEDTALGLGFIADDECAEGGTWEKGPKRESGSAMSECDVERSRSGPKRSESDDD